MATRRKTASKTRPTTRRPRRAAKISKLWTREEIAFLRKYYRKYETDWCARQLGRTVYSIRYKASDLNVRKANPSKWVKSDGRKVTSKTKTAPRRKVKARPAKKTTRWSKPKKNSRRTRR